MLKKLLNCYWYYHPAPLKAFILAGIVLPAVFLLLTLIAAMCWRLVALTPYYQTGFVVQGLCNLVKVLFLIFCFRSSWNAAQNFRLTVRSLMVAFLLFLPLFWMTAPAKVNPVHILANDMYGRVYYTSGIRAKDFVDLKHRLESSIFPPSRIVISSGGGNIFAGLAIAKLVQEYNLDVHVEGVCASACANFIFPSGQNKWLSKNAIVMYHGNFLQEKFQSLIVALDKVDGDVAKLPLDLDLGVKDKEVVVQLNGSMEDNPDKDTIMVRRYLGISEKLTNLESLKSLERLESVFYRELGIDPQIGIYGQIGSYKEIYQSYQYDGFYYSIEDMKKMGIKNLHVKGGEWMPEMNPNISNFYKVELGNTKEDQAIKMDGLNFAKL